MAAYRKTATVTNYPCRGSGPAWSMLIALLAITALGLATLYSAACIHIWPWAGMVHQMNANQAACSGCPDDKTSINRQSAIVVASHCPQLAISSRSA